MASKQPFKLINIAQKLTTWSIRINKFFKHRLLSKRKHVLIISEDQPANLAQLKSLFIVNQQDKKLSKISREVSLNKEGEKAKNFEQELLNNLYKTWEINQIKSVNSDYLKAGLLSQHAAQLQTKEDSQKAVQKSKNEQVENEEDPSTIVIPKFTDKQAIETMEQHWTTKRKYFDSIIVMPQKEQPNLYPEISDQAFATSFISTFEEKMLKNMMAYRYAHKFLNTSGTIIQSVSEYDFLKKSDQDKQREEKKKLESKSDKKQEDTFSYCQTRPPASKQIIDATICYMGVTIGDRDHTDLNSWTLVSLGEEASWKNPKYAARMYYDWADGQHLPMPGSFALFKKKIFDDKKELDFIQYL